MASQLHELQEDGSYVALTHDHLNAQSMMDRVRSPQAGAIVLFAGELFSSRASGLVSYLPKSKP